MSDSPTNRDDIYYLVLRPISGDAGDAEEYLERLRVVTGLDHITLRQRVSGTAPRVLKTAAGEVELRDMARELKRDGLKCAVLKKSDIKGATRPRKAASVDISSKAVRLIGKDQEALITIDASSSTLIVLASTEYEGLNSKRLAKKTLGKAGSLTKEEALQFILRHNPVMDIYTDASAGAVRVYGGRFNFRSLGELMREAVSLNFETLIKEIGEASGSTILETGFGESQLPFLSPMKDKSPERKLGNFNRYSRFIHLLVKDDIYKSLKSAGAGGLLPELPVFKELGGVLWGGPLKNPARGGDGTNKKPLQGDDAKTPASSTYALPPPPPGLNRGSSNWRKALFKDFFPRYKRLVRGLGPALVFYPLTAILGLSLISTYVLEHHAPLSVSLVSFGMILFAHSFVALKRKRAIENCPRSKLRSMPMGEVEVSGRTRPKYLLMAPYSMTHCVHYSYKVYERVHTKNGESETLCEWGESGPVPFYLEDEGVRVTVMPENAVLKAGRSETFRGGRTGMLGLWSGSSSESGRRIVETTIPVGEKLYVLGYARRLTESGRKQKKMTEKLRELKSDRGHLITHYDHDRNGEIDSDEWDAARSDVESELLKERLSKETSSESVVVGEHPAGGLFYISDRKEEHILKTLAWKTPISFILGVSSFACGLYYLLKILGNNDIIYKLMERINDFAA